ncbi:transcription initiation factor TFIID subunit 11-like [Eriocheir sinensis]|uniref:transcription initiation factor TFIID subunit 11-like n=1 Tax=Eriocheir sinensis TaxID=95602 RepID=UPI0021C740FE|nr:transcription initiation factor TFIID subunit 11-like [Eriocheir sinensis]
MVHKKDIRRVVYGTCVVVAPPGEGSSAANEPSRVTVSVRRRRGFCGILAGPWKELVSFSFSDRLKAPFFDRAFLDLERVFKYNRKADASAAQVKICVTLRSGVTRVARVSLDDFMGQLLQSGRPECFFLYVYEEKVVLLQAHTPLPEVPTEWPFDGVANNTHRDQKGGKDHTSNDPNVTGPEKTETIDHWVENNAPTNDSARKAEKLFPAEDKESNVAENDRETQEETVNDENKEALNDRKESGRGHEDSDESDWETLEVTAYAGEESDLSTDEGTDEEDECEADDEDSQDSEREPDGNTGETDVETEETEWETDEEHSEEETEQVSDEDSEGSGWETTEDDAEEDTDEGLGSERGSGRGLLARLTAAWRHHCRGLLVAAEVALIIGTLKVWGPPAYIANWRWGGTGGEL